MGYIALEWAKQRLARTGRPFKTSIRVTQAGEDFNNNWTNRDGVKDIAGIDTQFAGVKTNRVAITHRNKQEVSVLWK